MTGVGLFIAASGSCSSAVGVIGPACGAVLAPGKSCPDFPWKLNGDDDQAVEDIDGELAAYKDGALLQLAGVAATNGSEIALKKSAVSAALANLNSTYPRRSTSSRGAYEELAMLVLTDRILALLGKFAAMFAVELAAVRRMNRRLDLKLELLSPLALVLSLITPLRSLTNSKRIIEVREVSAGGLNHLSGNS